MTLQEQKQIFGDNLRRLLSERGLQQVEVCAAIGVPPQTFNNWMLGQTLPRMNKVQALADFLHLPKSALIDPPGTEPATVEALLMIRPDLDALLEAARHLSPSDVQTLIGLAKRLGGDLDV